MKSRVPRPGDGYLLRLGELVYTISYMEQLALGDVGRLAQDLPPALALGKLIGKTTGKIGEAFRTNAKQCASEVARTYIEACGDSLERAAKLRNAVLHARPAADDANQQRLLRDSPAFQEHFWIDDAGLDRTLEELNELFSQMLAARPDL